MVPIEGLIDIVGKDDPIIFLTGVILKYLKVKKDDYNFYIELVEGGDTLRYRIEFKEPIKMPEKRFDKFFRFLKGIGSHYERTESVDHLIIEGKFKQFGFIEEYSNINGYIIFIDYDQIEYEDKNKTEIYVVNIYFEKEDMSEQETTKF